MALIVLASAGGSPGTSTTALSLALSWPRPSLLVEADPSGGSSFLTGWQRGVISPRGGIAELVLGQQQNRLDAAVHGISIPFEQAQMHLMPGPLNHAQAERMTSLWPDLTNIFKAKERDHTDVIVDAGHLGLRASPDPVIVGADLLLLTVHSNLPSIGRTRSWAIELKNRFELNGAADNIGLLIVGPGRPETSQDVADVLGLPVITSIDWDPASAAVYHRGATLPRRFTNSAMVKSTRGAIAAIATHISRTRDQLQPARATTEIR